MLEDDIRLDLRELKALPCVFEGGLRVSGQVSAVALRAFGVKIVKKPGTGSLLSVKAQPAAEQKAVIRYVQAVLKPGHAVMMVIIFEILHLLAIQNVLHSLMVVMYLRRALNNVL